MSGVVEPVIDAAWAAAWRIVSVLPAGAAHAVFRWVADLAWWRRGKSVLRLESNLARVSPDASPAEIRALSRAGMRSYLRYWCEAFRLHKTSRQQVLDMVVTHNEDAFWKAIESGRGIVAALPHQGNWDLAAAWVHASGGSLTTVAERLRPEKLFDRFLAYRQSLGMEVLPLTGGVDPFPVLTERIREGKLICLVADRDLSSKGIEVEFFGDTARMPAGPAALAVRAGAILMPVTMWYDGPQMHIEFHDAVEPRTRTGAIKDLTQQVADAFANGIAAHPQDWHMLQRLWLADLDKRAPG